MEEIIKPKENKTESTVPSETKIKTESSVNSRTTENVKKKQKLKSKKKKKTNRKQDLKTKGKTVGNQRQDPKKPEKKPETQKDGLKDKREKPERQEQQNTKRVTDNEDAANGTAKNTGRLAKVFSSGSKRSIIKKKTSAKPINVEKQSSYNAKISRHKKVLRRKRLIGVAAVLVVLGLIALYIQKRSYHNYRIVQVSEQEDVISTQYIEMAGKILRYSPDDVSLVTNKLETLWSETHTMQNPIADVEGSRAVVADRDGTTLEMYDKNGRTGTASTSYSIVKVKVSKSGLVAAILDNGSDTWINYYSYDGSLIAENQTKIDDPGYPLDLAVSDDGDVLMVTYQFVDGSDTTSYVAFYNFGDVGQNEDDRIVSGYKYEGVVIPSTEFLDESKSIAVRDDGFTLYKGKQIPKENKTIEVENEIVSVFYDENLVGLVFKNNDKEKQYRMEVYDTNGNLKFQKEFNIPYTTIKMSGGYIIMYNSSQICIMNGSGDEKYMGTVDGNISNFFKIGWNKYLMVMDNGVNLVKLT